MKIINWRIYVFKNYTENRIKLKIKEWIKHHDRVLRFVDEINDTFSTPLILYFVVIMSTFCIEPFILTSFQNSTEIIKTFFYLAGALFEFLLFCVTGQILISEADKLSYKCFSINWYEHNNPSIRFALRMVIMRGNKSTKMSAGKILELSFATCAATFRSSLSYYMFLNTLNDIEKEKLWINNTLTDP
ncbi:odorant receptor 85c-like isoform X1 [Diabrotica undecimpunctata]|uniref:odorant receptor 85c-like isoform X1 n=1 Tax=Diabrotica undecimpunctata TaxID=50387 RepID=UPI003B639139